ncbi:MAG TPA: DUF1569 domain-containing protein, partial [Vicinamibacteria bacterium]|nr:DUF1569 domain-containing protein [Vicinamibacteria bacterium]
SAGQMVCHLGDGFRMAMGRTPVRTSVRLLERTIVKWIALWVPVPWPHGLRTAPEIDQALGGTPPDDFAADTARLEALVEEFTAPARGFTWPEHPRLGRLSDRDWMRWGWRHMDHHLRQFGA